MASRHHTWQGQNLKLSHPTTSDPLANSVSFVFQWYFKSDPSPLCHCHHPIQATLFLAWTTTTLFLWVHLFPSCLLPSSHSPMYSLLLGSIIFRPNPSPSYGTYSSCRFLLLPSSPDSQPCSSPCSWHIRVGNTPQHPCVSYACLTCSHLGDLASPISLHGLLLSLAQIFSFIHSHEVTLFPDPAFFFLIALSLYHVLLLIY